MRRSIKQSIVSIALALLLLCLLLPGRAMAATSSLSGSSTVKPGDTVTLTLSVSSSIYGFSGTLNCSDNLSLADYSCSVDGWSVEAHNGSFSAYGTKLANGNIMTIKLKVSGSVGSGDAITASFSDLTGSDGEEDISLGTPSWSGSVSAPLSNNCDLSAITVSNATLSPAFSKNTTYYTTTVPYNTQKLNLDYNRAESSQTVSINGNSSFVVGSNTVALTVTAAAGNTKTYTIVVTRQQDPNYKPSNDATLSAITMEGGVISPKFDSKVLEYVAFVPHETEEITVSGTANSNKALGVTEIRQELTEDGDTACEIVCTAEDGTTKMTYTVHVYRMPAYTGGVPTVLFSAEEIVPADEPEPIVIPTTYEIPMRVNLPLVGDVSIMLACGIGAGLLLVILFLAGFFTCKLVDRTAEYEDEEPLERTYGANDAENAAYAEEPVKQEKSEEPVEPTQPEPEKPEPYDSFTSEESYDEEEKRTNEEVKSMSLDDLLNDIHNM